MIIAFVYINKFKDYPILYEYCTLLKARGNEVYYIGISNENEQYIHESGVKVFHLAKNVVESKFRFAAKVSNIVKTVNPDLIHVVHFRWCFFLPLLLFFSRKFVLDVRTIHIANKNGKHTLLSPLKDRITWIESLFFGNCIALTKEIRNKLRPSFRDIPVIPLGASRSKFHSNQNRGMEIRAQLGIGVSKKVFLYSGTLCQTRKIPQLIKSFNKLSSAFQDVHLLVVGADKDDPTAVHKLKEMTEALGLKSEITFTGFVQYNKLQDYYHAADIGVCYIPQVPYYDEQPPTKLFEYMAAGLVIIATRTSAIMNVVSDGVNGFLANDDVSAFSKGMASVIEKWDARSEIINSANLTLNSYSWDLIVDNYLIVYYSSLGLDCRRVF